MKTKMTKAMYGKSMMKKGGSKKSLTKAQMGKAVRSVDTNQYGSTGEVEKTNKKGATKFKTVEISNTGSSMTNPSSTPTARIDKTKYDKEGMETKGTTKDISVKKAQRMINRIGNKATMQKGGAMKKMQGGGKTGAQLKKEGQALKAKGAAMKKEGQELRKEGMYVKNNPLRAYVDRKLFGENLYDSGLGSKKFKKGGSVKKMMTGGMVNPNSSVSKQTVPGSRGVQSGVNPKASSSKVAGSRGSGRVNTPPSKAVPTAKRGGMVKKKR